jgi:hypothetical protein
LAIANPESRRVHHCGIPGSVLSPSAPVPPRNDEYGCALTHIKACVRLS